MAGSTPVPTGAVDEALLRETAETFAMLASPIRVHLLHLLSDGEHDVSWLADAVGGSVAMVSQHLAKLRLAGLVSSRRSGKRQLYSVDDPHIVVLVRQGLEHHDQLRRTD